VIRFYSIKHGAAGTRQTLALMVTVTRAGAALPMIQTLANTLDPTAWEGLMRQYWRFVEELEETLRPVDFQMDTLLRSGHMLGDCDDAAMVVGAVALAGQKPIRFVAVRRGPDSEFTHVFAEVATVAVRDKTYWLRVDPTAPTDADYTGWERMVQNFS